MSLSDQLTLSIVSHGHEALVEALVRQLAETRELDGVRLIVTLNKQGERFDIEEDLTSRLRISIIRNPSPLGFGANHNQAFQRCETEWFAVLNPDLSLPNDVFTALIANATELNAALVAPLVINSEGRVEDSVRWNLTPWSLLKRKMHFAGEGNVDDGRFRWFAGMFYLVKSDAFRQIGGFNSKYFLYCEDYDLCARMHLSGYRIFFQREVRVVHDARRATWKSRKYLAMHLKSMWRVWSSLPVWRIALRDSLPHRSASRE